MNAIPGFIPFDQYKFDEKECFLSGIDLESPELVPVFPSWLQQRYNLSENAFRLLDESFTSYGELTVPCSLTVKVTLEQLEKKMQTAWAKGYQGVEQLSDQELFLWIGRIMLALLYKEFEIARKQQSADEPLEVNPELLRKISNLHLLMQAMHRSVTLEDFNPCSVFRFKVDQKEDIFDYRDEINTLIFSMMANGVGIVLCLQDNGQNKHFHQQLLGKTANKTLQPSQFLEFCAKVYYSAYLFNRVPNYLAVPPDSENESIRIESLALQETDPSPVFDQWEHKVYAQVLEAFWKPWGITKFEILKKPESPLSLLLDEQGSFIEQPSF